jgi:integrase
VRVLVFLVVNLTGLRCSELQELRWRDVNMLEATLRVVDSKSEEGRRLIAIPQALVDELERHYQLTVFKGMNERVFCSATGGRWWVDEYGTAFRNALKAAGIDKRPRRLHDGRHGALTGMAANGSSPLRFSTSPATLRCRPPRNTSTSPASSSRGTPSSWPPGNFLPDFY